MKISDPVLSRGGSAPEAPALSDPARSVTYGELARRIEAGAARLASLGVQPQDRVMIVGENSVSLAVAILACAHLGAVAVMENARRAPMEVDAILEHARPKLALFALDHSADAAEHARRAGAVVSEEPALGRVAVTGEHPKGSFDASARDASADLAAFIYTTGTTGAPKGVMLTHANLCFIAGMMGELRAIDERDRIYGVLPISHVMGLASVLLGGLHAGAHVHLRSRFSADRCLGELADLGISVLQGATAMFAKLNEAGRRSGWTPPASMRFIGAGGAPIDVTVKRRSEELFGAVLHNGYGLTEAASLCWTRLDEPNEDDSVGRPLPGVELRLRDASGGDTPAGETGELWARGPNVMAGYFRNPELTAQVLTPDGWFNTQDLARIAPDGRVFIVGRAKDVIIRSGFKVNPLEVETALNRHPKIAHSAVVGRPTEGNEDIVAFLELHGGDQAAPADLSEHLRAWLSPYKHPNKVVIVDALPLAQNGKVLKKLLVELAKGA
jgi:acyl-CoA synthetase (AMP-forming)/AMP-acid ligase II